MLVIVIIAFAALVGFLVYKKFGAKKDTPAVTVTKPRATKPKTKPAAPKPSPGYDANGKPVKMDNETGPDFIAREAQHYYLHGRS